MSKVRRYNISILRQSMGQVLVRQKPFVFLYLFFFTFSLIQFGCLGTVLGPR